MILVLDSSAFFSIETLPDGECYCTPGVINELKKYKDKRLDLWGDMLTVVDCSVESLKIVKEKAKKSGDFGRLSSVDMTVIALGLDLKGTVLSDDYSIENLCSILNIPYKPLSTHGIKKTVRWNYQCIGCRKWYKEKMSECQICGSQMIARQKR